MSSGPYKVDADSAGPVFIVRENTEGRIVESMGLTHLGTLPEHTWCARLNRAYALGAEHARAEAAAEIAALTGTAKQLQDELRELNEKLRDLLMVKP